MKNFLFLSLAVTFCLIPFEGARAVLFGAPIYLVEIGVIASAAALLFLRKQSKPSPSAGADLQSASVVSAHHRRVEIKRAGCKPALAPKKWVEWRKWEQGEKEMKWGIFFLLFGVISSTLVALSNHSICPLSHDGLLRALGIMKSWFVFPMLFGYILFHASRTYFSHEKLIFIFLVSFLPISILSLTGWLFGSGMTYDGRLEGFFNSPNALAMYLTPALILSWYFFRVSPQERICNPLRSFLQTYNKQKPKEPVTNPLLRQKNFKCQMSFFIFHFSFFIFISLLLFLTRSVSAWIAVSIALFFFEIMRMRNIRVRATPKAFGAPLRYATIFLLFAGIVILSQWDNPRFENFFDPDSRSSFASRLMIWQSAGKMIVDSPVFGVGPGNFQSCYLAYQQYFSPYLEWSVPEPHNMFLAFWLGGGIIGLFGFGFLVLWWFRNIFRSIQKEGDRLLLALVAIMIATLLHGLVDTPYWRLGLSYIFWIVFFAGFSSFRHSRENGNPDSTNFQDVRNRLRS